MATESTPQENDPTADNRTEYSLPPAALKAATNLAFDDDGCEIDDGHGESVEVGEELSDG